MVLVDTSVWIRFLSNKAPYAVELDRLLQRDDVAGHPMVYGELLIGDLGGRKELLQDYPRMHAVDGIPHLDVLEFVRSRKLHGRGIGWIDAHLLASAMVADVPFWTADGRLAGVAGELGASYRPANA